MKTLFVSSLLAALMFAILGTLSYSLPSDIVKNNTVKLKWDHNDPLPEGYRIFQKIDGGSYDYQNPEWQGVENTATLDKRGPVYPDLLPVTNLTAVYNADEKTIVLNWRQENPEENNDTYYYVVRAYKGEHESIDSNEVSINLVAINEPTKFAIYYTETPGENYTEFTSIDYVNDGFEHVLIKPFTFVKPGENKNIYFAIVTFGLEGTYSQNSEEAMVTIDRSNEVPAPSGLDIEVVFPVE
jgi:hypothetical protein